MKKSKADTTNTITRAIWLDQQDFSKVHFVDQRYIPFKVNILTSNNPTTTAAFIKDMVIRGAPSIGGAAAYGMLQSAVLHNTITDTVLKKTKIQEDALMLVESRPTAVDLKNVIIQMTAYIESIIEIPKEKFIEKVRQKAEEIVTSIIAECQLLADTGYSLLKDNMNIVHHCNTGPLATIDIGSALGVIIQAHKKGKKIHVFVDETRPRLQGGRLTTWELEKESVPHTLIVDTVSATLMKQKKVDLILVGADRIARNGDFANKIGTYNLAVLAKYHKVPMYTVAPWSTFDLTMEKGEDIVIEERPDKEVTHVFTEELVLKQISTQSKVFNPAFDITPNELLTGIIAPGIILKPPFEKTIPEALKHVKKRDAI